VKLLDSRETVLLITGTSERAEATDRPLAQKLQQEIDARGEGHTYRRAVVLGDEEYLERPALHVHPTIAIGGPGANAVSQHFVGEVPTVWEEEDRLVVQVEVEDDRQRAALWGMDAAATAEAVDAFVSRGFLELLLDRIWRLRSEVIN